MCVKRDESYNNSGSKNANEIFSKKKKLKCDKVVHFLFCLVTSGYSLL